MRILIADDNQINREFLKAALSEPAVEICEAVNGAQALKLQLQQAFDLILMDIRMPEMDGIEATVAIRQAERQQSAVESTTARIIGLTADLQLTTTTNLKQQGFDDCLAKPISRETVRALLNNQTVAKGSVTESQYPVVDRAAALAAAGGNVELLDRLMGMLQRELGGFIPDIVAAIARQDLSAAQSPVHKIRGSAGYTGCLELKQAAAQLELALTRGKPEEIGPALADLEHAADNVSRL